MWILSKTKRLAEISQETFMIILHSKPCVFSHNYLQRSMRSANKTPLVSTKTNLLTVKLQEVLKTCTIEVIEASGVETGLEHVHDEIATMLGRKSKISSLTFEKWVTIK